MSFTDPRTALHEAREFADRGQYQEALERHVWFHEHALDHDRDLRGVRLSYALSDWVQLGGVYPPARAALVETRNRAAAALRGGDWSHEWFHDVASINQQLGAEGETADLFLDLHRRDPVGAAPFYTDAEPGLVAQGLYAVCAEHLPDPMARFEGFRAFRRELLSDIPHVPSLTDEQRLEHERIFREVMERGFADDVGRLLSILIAVGRSDEAEQVREAALAETQSGDVRKGLQQWNQS